MSFWNVSLFIMIFPMIALAENCLDVAVDKSRIGIVKNQSNAFHGLGWCGSYAASVLISHELGQQVSAMDLAFSNNEDEDLTNQLKGKLDKNIRIFSDAKLNRLIATSLKQSGDPLYQNISSDDVKNIFQMIPTKLHIYSGGLVQDVIEKSQKKGFCLESSFRSEFDLEGLQPIFDLLVRSKELKEVPICIQNDINNRLLMRFPGLNLPILLEILAKSTAENILTQVRDRACKRVFKNFNTSTTNCLRANPDGERFVDKDCRNIISNNLLKDLTIKKPVALDVFYGPDKPTEFAHSFVAIGSRKNKSTGVCEIEVRDSARRCVEKKCKNGSDYWIPLDLLKRHMFKSTVISSSK